MVGLVASESREFGGRVYHFRTAAEQLLRLPEDLFLVQVLELPRKFLFFTPSMKLQLLILPAERQQLV